MKEKFGRKTKQTKLVLRYARRLGSIKTAAEKNS